MEDVHDRDAGVEPDQIGERQRPERMRETQPRDRVDRLRLGDPSISAYAASLMNGIKIRFATNPGESFASAGSLPSSRASPTIAAAVWSEVCTAPDHLDEAEQGHGVEEMHPDHAIGPAGDRGERRDGMDDVLDARIASAGSASSAERKIASLTD